MGRRLRWGLGGHLVEVTMRTIQGRFLLRPSSRANSLIKGVLGRAQRLHGLKVVAGVFLSNHYHLLVIPESEKQLADFMRFVNTNLSKELGRLHDWPGPLFVRRYQAIPVSEEPEAQVARLRYLLEHGVKENLVPSPVEWPGVNCVAELERGRSELHGVWVDRTAIWKAHQRGETLPRNERTSRETLVLSPLPVWNDWSPLPKMEAIKKIVADVTQRAAERHRAAGTKPLGVRGVESQHPHARPQRKGSGPFRRGTRSRLKQGPTRAANWRPN